MIPLVVVSSDEQREAAQIALQKQEEGNDQFPGTNMFQQGKGPIYFHFDEQFWLERLMMAMMAVKIPFKVEYCERIPDGFTGFRGQHIKF